MQIEVKNICFGFDKRKIIENISFFIKPHEVTSIIGVSGCGKSTLLKILSGLIKVNTGKIYYGTDCNESIDMDALAIVFQDSTLFPWKTVKQNIELSCKKKVDVEAIAKEVGLLNFLNLYPDQLSGGMKQRAEFGRVLARSPKLLFMDEPFSRLDVQYRKYLQELFINIQKKRKPTTVIVTHDIDEALKVSRYIKVLVGSPVCGIIECDVEGADLKSIKESVEGILLKEFNSSINPNCDA